MSRWQTQGRGSGLWAALALVALPSQAAAQPLSSQPLSEEATLARADFVDRSRMLGGVLLGWSATSLVSGALVYGLAEDDFARSLGQQQLVWGAIDAAIAIASFAAVGAMAASNDDAPTWRSRRETVRTVFQVNFALDFAYVGAGALLWRFGGTDDWRGLGAGVMHQGAFLLGYDLVGAAVMAP
ncbi:MAG: hypothetical protein KC731_29850 [Myxococcales bacterium]|nr:hypothetical protein [Myxococcales bacterium]